MSGEESRFGSRRESGHSATEFALILPLAVMLIVAALGMAMSGVRGIVAGLAASDAARAAALYEDAVAEERLYAALPPALFRGGLARITSDGAGGRASNALDGELEAAAISNPALAAGPGGLQSVRRASPIVPVLPPGLTDSVLRGGDTPSPYCISDGGYRACGYPD